MKETPAEDDVTGWFDTVLTTYEFIDHIVGQFPDYSEAKKVAQRIMGMEHEAHPYAMRVLVKSSKRRLRLPNLYKEKTFESK